jgi:hypothetical protein
MSGSPPAAIKERNDCLRTFVLVERRDLKVSAMIILVMATPPHARLIASFGRAVEPRVHTPDRVKPDGRYRGLSGPSADIANRSKMTDAVEKGFSGGRTDFFRGTDAVVRK